MSVVLIVLKCILRTERVSKLVAKGNCGTKVVLELIEK